MKNLKNFLKEMGLDSLDLEKNPNGDGLTNMQIYERNEILYAALDKLGNPAKFNKDGWERYMYIQDRIIENEV